MSQEVGKNRGEKNYKRSQTQQTLHHYLSFFLYLQKTNTIQAKPRRAHHMHGWTVVSSLPTAETRYDKKNFKKDDRVTLSMYKGNNNKQLCVAWEVKCSHHNEDAQKNFPRQKQTAGKTKHLTVLFFPTALVPSVTKKKKKGQVFCTLYNYNVFVAWSIYNAMAAKVRRLKKKKNNSAGVLYTLVRTRTYEKTQLRKKGEWQEKRKNRKIGGGKIRG